MQSDLLTKCRQRQMLSTCAEIASFYHETPYERRHGVEMTARRAVSSIPGNVARFRKMKKDDKRYTYHIIRYILEIGSVTVYKTLNDELKLKKIVSRWFPHHLTRHRKFERVRIS
ncbi:hypothetical protein EVAR_34028_1 [Eumeta japonica]|uniref:Four helix bundle protein n=1 Tax=Eumeta variegata TaxID=151549 RepID=A0A4C1VUU7_EUMVA|nr:hypothetical protein EVAR_34028_1 [Eumeta japonica]